MSDALNGGHDRKKVTLTPFFLLHCERLIAYFFVRFFVFLLIILPNFPLAVNAFTGGQAYISSMPAGAHFRDCDQCPDMVLMPAGSFLMGAEPGEIRSPELKAWALGTYPDDHETAEEVAADYAREGPRHQVTIGYQFAMAKYDVTFAEWDACVADGGCDGYRPFDCGLGRGQLPVFNVNWAQAQSYVTWLNNKVRDRFGEHELYRLPSEAEWEYAARGGTVGPRWWKPSWWDRLLGSGNIGNNYENCASCLGIWESSHLTPVGSFHPNPFGLYDMLGNLYQMTADCWNESYVGAPEDGGDWATGDCHSYPSRGASYLTTAQGMRVARRMKVLRDMAVTKAMIESGSSSIITFRLVRTVSAKESGHN
jgi:formylglycine-generating enzyme required for sulfatase activity